MTAERWKQVETLFHHAAELTSDERDAWLDSACGGDEELKSEVRALLASDDAAQGFVEEKVQGAIVGFHARQTAPQERRIGPYRLVSELGRGGMGTVYLAERADDEYQGKVAIKLVRPGMDTEFFLARFRRERQTLARLEHPNIARLLDSGTTPDGMPYLVMEWVRGVPITQYCRERKLSVDAILRLFLPVCAAVAHAHQHFVVHRDLKPGNILVDESGAPKLLDFGICKLLLHEPEDGTMTCGPMMTPDYASPEQVAGENVTVASDIYSLGAVLYELLTGVRPHAISRYTPREVERAICEANVRPPASVCSQRPLARQLAGDLDNIVLEAMRREPSRRYASAEQLAADIRAHLEHRPVAARADNFAYRARKFARRNRASIAAGSAIALAMSAAIVMLVMQARMARNNFADARKLANALVFDVHDKIRDLPGSLPARQAIARITMTYLDRLSASAAPDADFRHELAAGYEQIGAVLGDVLGSSTGDTTGAMVCYRKGLAAIAQVAGSPDADRMRVILLRRIGDVQHYTGHAPDALNSYNEAIRAGTELHDTYPKDHAILMALGDAYDSLERTLRTEGRPDRAVEVAARAVKLYQDAVAANPADHRIRGELAGAISVQGTIFHLMNRLEEARQNFVQATALWDDVCRLEANNMHFTRQRMLAYSHLGEVLGSPDYPNLGDQAGSLAAFQEMLAIARKTYERNPTDHGALVDYGMSLMRTAGMPGQTAEQRTATYREAVEKLGEVARLSPDNRTNLINLAALHEQFGDFLKGAGQFPEAREEYLRGASIAQENLGATLPANRIFITTSRNLALDAARRGNDAEAVEYATKAVAVGEKASSAKDAGAAARSLAPRAYAAMGDVREAVHDQEGARHWRERALAVYREIQTLPGFGAPSRKEMERVEGLLKRETSHASRATDPR